MKTNVKRVVVFAVLSVMSLSWMAFFIPPWKFIFFHLCSFIIPAFILLAFTLVLIGIIKKDKALTIFSSIALLGNIYYIPFILQPSHDVVDFNDTTDLRIITYNVGKFHMEHNMPSLAHITEFLARSQPQIVCLQEVTDEQTVRVLQDKIKMPFAVISNGPSHDQRLAILSKHPLGAQRTLHFPGRPHLALFVEVEIKRKKIRLMNCHLQTTNLNQVRGNKSIGLLKGADLILNNSRTRGRQAAMIERELKASPVNLICGDFNVPPISYSYLRLKRGLSDAFMTAGSGYGYTYRYLMKLFRIDYVFYDEQQFKAINYNTEDLDFSDHLPVIVDMKHIGKK